MTDEDRNDERLLSAALAAARLRDPDAQLALKAMMFFTYVDQDGEQQMGWTASSNMEPWDELGLLTAWQVFVMPKLFNHG